MAARGRSRRVDDLPRRDDRLAGYLERAYASRRLRERLVRVGDVARVVAPDGSGDDDAARDARCTLARTSKPRQAAWKNGRPARSGLPPRLDRAWSGRRSGGVDDRPRHSSGRGLARRCRGLAREPRATTCPRAVRPRPGSRNTWAARRYRLCVGRNQNRAVVPHHVCVSHGRDGRDTQHRRDGSGGDDWSERAATRPEPRGSRGTPHRGGGSRRGCGCGRTPLESISEQPRMPQSPAHWALRTLTAGESTARASFWRESVRNRRRRAAMRIPLNKRFARAVGLRAIWARRLAWPVSVDLSLGRTLGGAFGNDLFVGPWDDLAGARFADTLIGDAASNEIFGGPGNDHIEGRAGRRSPFRGRRHRPPGRRRRTDECLEGETVLFCEP